MMEPPRRRGGGVSGVPTAAVAKAVAVGMIVGLLISLAGFYHKSRLEALQAGLQSELTYHESSASEERHKRELAEQMQAEADTERTKLQGQLKEQSASVLEAQAAEKAARAAEKKANAALEAAKEKQQKATEEAKAAAEQLEELQEELRKVKQETELTKQDWMQASGALSIAAGQGGDRHTPWLPSDERDAADLELATILRKVAKNNEVLVAISNRNYAGKGNMLDAWMRNVKRSGVSNALVVALDQETKKHAESEGFASLMMTLKISESQKDVGENHAVSGLKFKILQRFLELGYSVLLSDVDIITLQNPFDHLFRDADVESMSDGWDNATAYGYNDVADDPSMGWARYAHSMRVFCFNSGLFYIRPTEAALQLLKQVMHRIETEAGWDQAIFNEVIFFPSHNEYKDPAVTRRVMDIFKFMNSKVLFKQVRHNPDLKRQTPVTLHANYHANKGARLKAAEDFWVHGDDTALMAMPEGS